MPSTYDAVKDTTTTTGTGTFTLANSAPTGYRTFGVAAGGDKEVYYSVFSSDRSEWENGIGQYTHSGTTLSRVRVLSSSNSNALVNFSAGTKTVICAPLAGQEIGHFRFFNGTAPSGYVLADGSYYSDTPDAVTQYMRAKTYTLYGGVSDGTNIVAVTFDDIDGSLIVLYSEDNGATWLRSELPADEIFSKPSGGFGHNSVVYLDGNIVVCCQYGGTVDDPQNDAAILYSADGGETFSSKVIATTSGRECHSIAYGNGNFVAVSKQTSGTQFRVYAASSIDGSYSLEITGNTDSSPSVAHAFDTFYVFAGANDDVGNIYFAADSDTGEWNLHYCDGATRPIWNGTSLEFYADNGVIESDGLTFGNAEATLEFTANPSNTETVTIGADVYTFVVAAALPFEVTIGADESESLNNLQTVIETDGTEPVRILGGTAVTGFRFSANDTGAAGNSISVSTTVTGASWSGATFEGGVDSVAPNVAISTYIYSLEHDLYIAVGDGGADIYVGATIETLANEHTGSNINVIVDGATVLALAQGVIARSTDPENTWADDGGNPTLYFTPYLPGNNYNLEGTTLFCAMKIT